MTDPQMESIILLGNRGARRGEGDARGPSRSCRDRRACSPELRQSAKKARCLGPHEIRSTGPHDQKKYDKLPLRARKTWDGADGSRDANHHPSSPRFPRVRRRLRARAAPGPTGGSGCRRTGGGVGRRQGSASAADWGTTCGASSGWSGSPGCLFGCPGCSSSSAVPYGALLSRLA